METITQKLEIKIPNYVPNNFLKIFSDLFVSHNISFNFVGVKRGIMIINISGTIVDLYKIENEIRSMK